MQFSTYPQALTYIFSHTNYERQQMPKYSLDTLDILRISRLLAQLDNPQNRYPVMLIAGTKGKGSTAAMSYSLLKAAGYQTGLYSSPHLHSFRERIRLNDRMITEAEVVRLVNRLAVHFDQVTGLTAWEVMTTLAFTAFAEANLDAVVLEVGLGGRLDATNITTPMVSVITSISYDHTHLLGNTLTLIAREKAGIIKPGGTVICAPQYPEAMSVIETVCREQHATLTVVGDDICWQTGRVSLQNQHFYLNKQPYTLPLLGKHQVVNAVTALTAVNVFGQKTGLTVTSQAACQGLATVAWPGRFEILSHQPMLIVDGAMNGDSAEKLRQTLVEYFPGRDLVLVFGASSDHDYRAMFSQLLPAAKRTIVTQANHPRATPPNRLAATAQTLGFSVETAPTVAQALEMALDQPADRDLIGVTGSLFCVAEARFAWAQRAGLPLPEVDPV